MFKPKNDSITIGQQLIKIPCKNGLQFQEDVSVVFDVPRGVGFADLSNAYIEVDVQIGVPNSAINANMPLLQPDRVTGCQSMINMLRIVSESGRKIEELYPYNVMAQLHYNATQDEGIVNKRSRLEGCAASYQIMDSPFAIPNRMTTSTNRPDTAAAPANPEDPLAVIATANDSCQQVTRKVCLPLLGGMFQSSKSFPCTAIPFSVHILLEKASRCLRLTGEDEMVPLQNSNVDGLGAGARNVVYVSARAKYSGIGGGAGPAIPINCVEGEEAIHRECNFPFRVGQQVMFAGTNSATVVRTITRIGVVAIGGVLATRGMIQISLDGNACTAGVADGTFQMWATDRLGTGALIPNHVAGYSWNNPRLVIPKVVPPPSTVQSIGRAISQGKYAMDIISYTSYQNAITGGITASANIIPAELTRAKAIVSIPIEQADLDLVRNSNALCGQYLAAERYIYSINNQLRPDRHVELAREQFPALLAVGSDEIQRPYQYGKYIGAFHLHECEKTLVSADINPRNLKFITLTDNRTDAPQVVPTRRSGSWWVGRALGAGPGTSENLVTKAVILYLDYRAGSPNKLLYNFVVHVRTIAVGMSGTEIFY